MVLVEVARIDAAHRRLHPHADHLAAGEQIVGPLRRATRTDQPLRHRPAGVKIEGLACDADLLDAGMLAVMEEDDLAGAAGDALRLVEGGVADRQAVARRHVAIGVVREGGVDRAARDKDTACGKGWPGAG